MVNTVILHHERTGHIAQALLDAMADRSAMTLGLTERSYPSFGSNVALVGVSEPGGEVTTEFQWVMECLGKGAGKRIFLRPVGAAAQIPPPGVDIIQSSGDAAQDAELVLGSIHGPDREAQAGRFHRRQKMAKPQSDKAAPHARVASAAVNAPRGASATTLLRARARPVVSEAHAPSPPVAPARVALPPARRYDLERARDTRRVGFIVGISLGVGMVLAMAFVLFQGRSAPSAASTAGAAAPQTSPGSSLAPNTPAQDAAAVPGVEAASEPIVAVEEVATPSHDAPAALIETPPAAIEQPQQQADAPTPDNSAPLNP